MDHLRLLVEGTDRNMLGVDVEPDVEPGYLPESGCVRTCTSRLHVGLDIHAKHTCACALDEAGQVTHRTRVRALDELLRFLEGLPGRDRFTYTFDNLAKVVDELTEKVGLARYALYVQDYGAPVGYRLAVKHPERVTAIVVQNGKAYQEGLDNDFWEPIKAYWQEPTSQEKRDALRGFVKYEATRWQYTHGVRNPELVSPDGPAHDQFLLDRPGNDEIQLDLFLSYGSNPPLYPRWQEYFRRHKPPVLIAWGKNDQIFPAAGAEPYRRDLKTLEYHLLDAGHFAQETEGDAIAGLMREFLSKHAGRR